MLRKYGVSGLEVQEIFSLDEFTLSQIRRPVYGIILLMKYDETEDVEEEIDELDNLWFANQACFPLHIHLPHPDRRYRLSMPTMPVLPMPS